MSLALLITTLVLGVPPAAVQARPNPFVGTVSDETFEQLGYMLKPGPINQIARAGIGTLRQTFDWQYLRKDGTLNWFILDHYVAGVAKRGIRIIPVLFNPPTELTTMPPAGSPVRGFYPTSNPEAIGAYGALLAARYGTTGTFWAKHPRLKRLPITTWQIWNEPNLPFYWRPHLSPKGYTRMLCAASRQIKAVDPHAEILTAGLPKSRIRGSIWPSRYVPRMLRAGARGCFDTVALNAYAPTGKGVVRLVSNFRRVLDRVHAGNVGLRVTEFGWADRAPERPRGTYTAGATRQGRFISQALKGLWHARRHLKLRGVVYYAWRDQRVYAGGKNFWGLHTGLHRVSGKPKPAFRSFRRTVRSLR